MKLFGWRSKWQPVFQRWRYSIVKEGKSAHLLHMPDIARPFVTDDDPDRHIRCQDTLEAAFRELVSAATSVGWSEREVVLAIADLADNHLLSVEANSNTDTLIALLMRMT